MGLREISGAVATAFIGVYMLFFVIPVGRTAYNTEIAHLNTTSALMQTILPITNNWWLVFAPIIAICCGYVIWQYATDQFGFDY